MANPHFFLEIGGLSTSEISLLTIKEFNELENKNDNVQTSKTKMR